MGPDPHVLGNEGQGYGGVITGDEECRFAVAGGDGPTGEGDVNGGGGGGRNGQIGCAPCEPGFDGGGGGDNEVVNVPAFSFCV